MFSSLTIIRKKKAYRKNENKRKNCQMKLLCEKEDFFVPDLVKIEIMQQHYHCTDISKQICE